MYFVRAKVTLNLKIMTSNEFNLMVQPFQPALKSFAFQFTKDDESADDLVQETMLKMIMYEHKFEPGTNLKAWLFMIMRNTFINNYRRNKKKIAIIKQDEVISFADLHHSAVNNLGENKFVMKDINRALSRLSESLRKPFVRYVEGYKYHEIAEELAIPIGTVKTRIHHARTQLKNNLKVYQ